jgi:hypothetical protein
MKAAMKWILGIGLGLAAVIVTAAAGYLLFSRWFRIGWLMDGRPLRLLEGGRAFLSLEMPMHPVWGAPLSRFTGFSPFWTIAGGLIWLSLLALIIFGVVALARNLVSSQPSAAASGQASPAAAPPALICSNCGRPVQAGWLHCPFCGHALMEEPSGGSPPS